MRCVSCQSIRHSYHTATRPTVMTSKFHATHITTMYAGQKVQKALKHNVRALERVYAQGEEVYYRRNSNRAKWRGQATVLGNRSSVYFLVHQGDIMSVAACRIVATEDNLMKLLILIRTGPHHHAGRKQGKGGATGMDQ